jgi:pimeloyl-ACP methyl ester carboxylesterase
MNRPCVVASLLLAAGVSGAAPPPAEPAGCALRSPAVEAVEAVEAAAPLALTGEIAWIGSQGVEFWAHRARRPRATLVFENGLMLPLATWQKVVQALADEADILLYNRPGVGRSTLPEAPQDPKDAARLVRELLRVQELPAPYIVVGHSMGGLHAQLFARLYAQEVDAMLLVDALPPGALKPSAQFPWYTQLGLRIFAPEYVQREITAAQAIGDSLLGEGVSFDKPVIRLIATPDAALGKPKGLVRDLLDGVVYAADFGVWAVDPDTAQGSLDQLYPRSTVRHLRAHHRMQEAAPAPVIEAIRELMGGAGCPPG